MSISVCRFIRLERALTGMSGREDDIYMMIALTELSESTGMFALYGRHEDDSSTEKEQVPILHPGDTLVWTRSTRGRTHQAGADGMSVIIVYR